jgi:hypothetical protein
MPLLRPPLSIEQILAWADSHYVRTGRWPLRKSGSVIGVRGETWLNIDQALRVGVRGLPGGDSLPRLLARARNARARPSRPPLTESQIVAWTVAYYERVGSWPTPRCGQVPGQPGETWAGVYSALQRGCRGLPGGDTLRRLLERSRGVPHPTERPMLLISEILAWADRHRERTGAWPTARDGDIRDAPGECWRGIDGALREGRRGMRGGSSLACLLAKYRGRRNKARLPALTPHKIMRWAAAFKRQTGCWPGVLSGPVPNAPGESWQAINLALFVGLRGLPGGDSLAKLLARHGRRRTRAASRQLAVAGQRHRPAG